MYGLIVDDPDMIVTFFDMQYTFHDKQFNLCPQIPIKRSMRKENGKLHFLAIRGATWNSYSYFP